MLASRKVHNDDDEVIKKLKLNHPSVLRPNTSILIHKKDKFNNDPNLDSQSS